MTPGDGLVAPEPRMPRIEGQGPTPAAPGGPSPPRRAECGPTAGRLRAVSPLTVDPKTGNLDLGDYFPPFFVGFSEGNVHMTVHKNPVRCEAGKTSLTSPLKYGQFLTFLWGMGGGKKEINPLHVLGGNGHFFGINGPSVVLDF